MSKLDFFFGEKSNSSGVATFRLSDAIQNINHLPSGYLTYQINRLLRDNNREVVLSDGTSSPEFGELLAHIDPSMIGFIEIYARTDVNQNVNATLACDLYLLDGKLTIKAHWCAYKEIRSDEIIHTLLVPIHLANLQSRTFIRKKEGKKERLLEYADDYASELRRIFDVSTYKNQERIPDYILSLRACEEVVKSGIAGAQAIKEFYDIRLKIKSLNHM